MSNEQEAVKVAIEQFYNALDDLLRRRGNQPMKDIWLHEDFVTTVHPFGHWARGWQEVWATWLEIEAVFGMYHGHDQRPEAMGGPHDVKIAIAGDVAYAISVFRSKMYLSDGTTTGLNVNCTNILFRRDGAWKIVHHHPDQASPDFVAAVQRIVAEGSAG